MRCTPLLYIETDVDIPLQIAAGSELSVEDIQDLEVTLTHRLDAEITKTYQFSEGQITIDGNDILLLISREDITQAGHYAISIRMTDQASKIRGITPCPNILRFHT